MKKPDRVNVNEKIRAQEVRVIGPDGEQIGIMKVREALELAFEKGLDLVEVAQDATPPVCRIMDYGKYKYIQKKRQQGSKKKRGQVNIKEVKFRIKIEDHDLNFKVRNIRRFITDGNKVKVAVVFRGREFGRQDLAMELVQKIQQGVSDIGVVDQEPKLEGKILWMMLSPRFRPQKAQSAGKLEESQNAKGENASGSSKTVQGEC